MKGTAAAMTLELAASSRIARCWKITTVLAGVLTITDHDLPIIDPTDGLTYYPIPGGSSSDIASDISMQADNIDITGANLAPGPTMESIRAGDWDYAEIIDFYICWADPSKGRHLLRTGNVGELSASLTNWKGEVRGLIQKLSTSVGDLTQAACRHRFGDDLCNLDGKTDPDDWSVTGVIDDVSADGITLYSTSFVEIDAAGSPAPPAPAGGSGSFAFGKIRMEDGANAGRTKEIETSINGVVSLHLPFPYPVAIGDAFTAYYGCDGLRETCKNTYDNILNFDGEPWLPGLDKTVSVARSE